MSVKSCTVGNKDDTSKAVELNRSILSSSNSYTLRSSAAINFKKISKYPLSPLPLSICNDDGSRRCTAKSQ